MVAGRSIFRFELVFLPLETSMEITEATEEQKQLLISTIDGIVADFKRENARSGISVADLCDRPTSRHAEALLRHMTQAAAMKLSVVQGKKILCDGKVIMVPEWHYDEIPCNHAFVRAVLKKYTADGE